MLNTPKGLTHLHLECAHCLTNLNIITQLINYSKHIRRGIVEPYMSEKLSVKHSSTYCSVIKIILCLSDPYVHSRWVGGPALMAKRSNVPPLTANCLSPLPGFQSHSEHIRKLPVTGFRLGGGFHQVLWFPLPHAHTIGLSQFLAAIWQKKSHEKCNSKFQTKHLMVYFT